MVLVNGLYTRENLEELGFAYRDGKWIYNNGGDQRFIITPEECLFKLFCYQICNTKKTNRLVPRISR